LGLYNRPEVASVPGDVSPTPLKKKTEGPIHIADRTYSSFKEAGGKDLSSRPTVPLGPALPITNFREKALLLLGSRFIFVFIFIFMLLNKTSSTGYIVYIRSSGLRCEDVNAWNKIGPRVGVGSNTSTVALRVIGGYEEGYQCLGVLGDINTGSSPSWLGEFRI
jgi:hypothetical protein